VQPPPAPVSARGDGRQALQQRAHLLARQKEIEELQLQLEQERTALERELIRCADGGPACAHTGEVNRKLAEEAKTSPRWQFARGAPRGRDAGGAACSRKMRRHLHLAADQQAKSSVPRRHNASMQGPTPGVRNISV